MEPSEKRLNIEKEERWTHTVPLDSPFRYFKRCATPKRCKDCGGMMILQARYGCNEVLGVPLSVHELPKTLVIDIIEGTFKVHIGVVQLFLVQSSIFHYVQFVCQLSDGAEFLSKPFLGMGD